MAVCAAPVAVRFEHHAASRPLIGIGQPCPRLSWIVPAADEDYRQSGYEIEVSRGPETRSFVVDSGEQVLVPWPDRPLTSRERACVRVRVRGDGWSDWSDPAVVEAGLLGPDEWVARFVSPATRGAIGMPAPVLRGETVELRNIASARLYATAHGVYSMTINGQAVGDDLLAPGWTSYDHRLRYQAYDVTDLLRDGRNVVEAVLGNGWYRGRLGWEGRRALYGDRLALLAQMEVTMTDGGRYVLATDGSWSAHDSGIVADDLYDGQRTDLRSVAGGEWDRVEVVPGDLGRLVAPDGPPVRVTQTLPAVAVWTSPSGATLVDFGQNLVGWVRIRVDGRAAGNEVTVRHAEVLEHGELGVRPLRSARATDSYVLAGGAEVLEPRFTFHGFRYAEISGCDGLGTADVEAVVIGTDLTRTGWFSSSDELLNRFHENVVWAMRGNFLDIPTDCPQRDERLGWTGDIQVFSPTATFLFDSAGFLTSWLKDLAADQQADGSVPFVIPDALRNAGPAAAAWGDAATVVPWVLYQRTGDAAVLERQLHSMRAWVDHLRDLAGDDGLWSGGFQFGDWLDPTAPPDQPFRAQVDPDVVASAHLARSAEIVGLAADVIGEEALAEKYRALAQDARRAFADEFVTPHGRILSDSPTAYSMALEWALLPDPAQRVAAGARLADLVRTSGFRISTGFVGTPLIADALTSSGHADVAYRLLLQTGCPSWLYPVTMGATTTWERWDSMLPDGSINPGQMTSFNHYALGAVADWLHRSVAGLAPAAPGFRRVHIAPVVGGGITRAEARHRSPYGEVHVSWDRTGDRLRLSATVPVGTTATVKLPGVLDVLTVGHGRHAWEVDIAGPPRPALPLTIRDVMDDAAAWRRVVEIAHLAGAARDEPDVARRLSSYLDHPPAVLADVLTAHTHPGEVDRAMVDALVAELANPLP